MEINGSLTYLTGLEALILAEHCDGISLPPAAQLPASLTSMFCNLYCEEEDRDALPHQASACHPLHQLHPTGPPGTCSMCNVTRSTRRRPPALVLQLSALTNLRQLTLQFPRCGPDGYAPIQHLTALTRLVLEVEVYALPGCLTCLTQLRDLRVYSWNEGMAAHEAAGLAGALPSLQQLTRLDVYIEHEVPTAALTALTNLQTLWWESMPVSGTSALPPGAWVRGLRTLLLSASLAAASLSVLAAATQLERLGIRGHILSEQPPLPAIVAFAAERPSLRLLVLFYTDMPDDVKQAVQRAQRQCPDLHVVLGSDDGMHLLFDGDL